MDILALHKRAVERYQGYIRSFIDIRDADIRKEVAARDRHLCYAADGRQSDRPVRSRCGPHFAPASWTAAESAAIRRYPPHPTFRGRRKAATPLPLRDRSPQLGGTSWLPRAGKVVVPERECWQLAGIMSRIKKAAKIVLICLGVLLPVLVGQKLWFRAQANRLIAEIRAAGEPTNLAELDAWHVAPPR